MPFTLEWSRNRSLVKARHFGDVTTGEIRSSLNALALEIGSTRPPHLLVDLREVTGYPSIGELYFLMEKNHHEPLVSTNTAFLYEKGLAREMEAVVATAATHGRDVKAFLEETAAIAWLFAYDECSRRRRAHGR